MGGNERIKQKLGNDLANYEKLKSDLGEKIGNILAERKAFEGEVSDFRGLEKQKFEEFEIAQKNLDEKADGVEEKLEELRAERANIEKMREEVIADVKGWGLGDDDENLTENSDTEGELLKKSKVSGLGEEDDSPGHAPKISDEEVSQKAMENKIRLAARMNIYKRTQQDLEIRLEQVATRRADSEAKRDSMQETIQVKSVRMIGHEIDLKNVQKDVKNVNNKSSVNVLSKEIEGHREKINTEKLSIITLKIDLVREQCLNLEREEEVLRDMAENNNLRILVQKDWNLYWKNLSSSLENSELVGETRQFKKFEVDYKKLMADTEGASVMVEERRAKIIKEKGLRMVEKMKFLDQREKLLKAQAEVERGCLHKELSLAKKELELDEYKISLEKKLENYLADQAILDGDKASIKDFNKTLVQKMDKLNFEVSQNETKLKLSKKDLKKLQKDLSTEKSSEILSQIREKMAEKENSIQTQKSALEEMRAQLMQHEESLKMREAQLNKTASEMKEKGDKLEGDLANYEELKNNLTEKINNFTNEKKDFKKDKDLFAKQRSEENLAQNKERENLDAENLRIDSAKAEIEKRETVVNLAKEDISEKINKFLQDKSELESRTRNLDSQKLAIKGKEDALEKQQLAQIDSKHNIESEKSRLKSMETAVLEEKKSLKKKESLLQSKVMENEDLGKYLAEQLNDYETQKNSLKDELNGLLTEQETFKRQKSQFENEVVEFQNKKSKAAEESRRKSIMRNSKAEADRLEMLRLEHELEEKRRQMSLDFSNKESVLEENKLAVAELEAAVKAQKVKLESHDLEMQNNKKQMEKVKSELEKNLTAYLDNKKDLDNFRVKLDKEKSDVHSAQNELNNLFTVTSKNISSQRDILKNMKRKSASVTDPAV